VSQTSAFLAGPSQHPGHRLDEHERRWPATFAVLAVLGLQVVLPAKVSSPPQLLIPALEFALLVPIVATNPVRHTKDSPWLRRLALVLVAALASANLLHLIRLIVVLTSGVHVAPRLPLLAALLIWTTNLVTGALALWEIDRGGPFARSAATPVQEDPPDLLFPQVTGVPGWETAAWRPSFIDYLFVAFTAATTFGPTDTLPLSARAKLLITWMSSISLLTVAVVAAGAVNAL
jgi:hypothetical protein